MLPGWLDGPVRETLAAAASRSRWTTSCSKRWMTCLPARGPRHVGGLAQRIADHARPRPRLRRVPRRDDSRSAVKVSSRSVFSHPDRCASGKGRLRARHRAASPCRRDRLITRAGGLVASSAQRHPTAATPAQELVNTANCVRRVARACCIARFASNAHSRLGKLSYGVGQPRAGPERSAYCQAPSWNRRSGRRPAARKAGAAARSIAGGPLRKTSWAIRSGRSSSTA